MEIKFTSRVIRGNKTGTGFFYIPQNKGGLLNHGKRVKINLSNQFHFFSKVAKRHNKLGIYVPMHFVIGNNLLNTSVHVRLAEINGFYSKISPDGIIYIPKEVIEEQKIEINDIVLIKAFKNNRVVKEKYSKIAAHWERNSLEYVCVFDKNFYGKKSTFRIENRRNKQWELRVNSNVQEILRKFHLSLVNKNSAIIFKGNKIPAIIPTQIKYSDIVFYLGAYFADGTKKGNSWAICASTFEQARYYLEMHNLLIKDSKPEFTISYTNIYKTGCENLKKNLAKIWTNETGVKVDKFRIRKPTGKSTSKWNRYGTLVIREHRQILLDFYNALLRLLIREILSKENKGLAIDFICGVMEGDGCVPAKKRGHLLICTNKNEVHILEDILRILQIKFKVVKEGENKYSLRIGTLEILRNFHHLKSKIFILYPKRRKMLFKRLKTVGAIKFLIGDHQPCSWIKAWLKNNGFSDKNYKITKEGLKLGNILLDEMKKVRV